MTCQLTSRREAEQRGKADSLHSEAVLQPRLQDYEHEIEPKRLLTLWLETYPK